MRTAVSYSEFARQAYKRTRVAQFFHRNVTGDAMRPRHSAHRRGFGFADPADFARAVNPPGSPSARRSATGEPAPFMTGPRFRILAVDDSEDILALLEVTLGKEYEVKSAADARSALLVAFEKPRPDLILLDVEMPGTNGYDLCRALKASPTLGELCRANGRSRLLTRNDSVIPYSNRNANPTA